MNSWELIKYPNKQDIKIQLNTCEYNWYMRRDLFLNIPLEINLT